jgi:hypothetical protein
MPPYDATAKTRLMLKAITWVPGSRALGFPTLVYIILEQYDPKKVSGFALRNLLRSSYN